MSSELARIAMLRAVLEGAARNAPGVRVGIGDDAAVLEGSGESLVWTVDAQVEGTHFRLDWLSWQDVGFRSVMAAASDLAAMGAAPLAALASLVLAPSVDDAALEAIARGQAEASAALGLPVVGGNLARGAETSLTTTVLGRAPRPLLRSGARAGDAVWAAGPLGMAAAGLALLASSSAVAEATAGAAACVSAWRRPVARIADGLALRGVARAAIDVSDGLAGDLAHVARASDVVVVLDEASLRDGLAGPLLDVARALGRDPLELALAGGEDYALVAFTAPDATPPGFRRIGWCEQAGGDAEGTRIRLATPAGVMAVAAAGFDHFG